MTGQYRCYRARLAIPRGRRDYTYNPRDLRAKPYLLSQRVGPQYLKLCKRISDPELKRTCFFVLGLISSTPQGAEILDDYHWEATLSPLGLPTGLCVPTDIERFISVRLPSSYFNLLNLTSRLKLPTWSVCDIDDGADRLEPPASEEEIEVMTAIYNLANTVIANAASRTLAKYVPSSLISQSVTDLFLIIG